MLPERKLKIQTEMEGCREMKGGVCSECGSEGRYTCSKCRESKSCSVVCSKAHLAVCPAVVGEDRSSREQEKVAAESPGEEERSAVKVVSRVVSKLQGEEEKEGEPVMKAKKLPSPNLKKPEGPVNRTPNLSRPRGTGPLLESQLERLRFDPALRQMLHSPALRELLTKVDGAFDPRYLTETALLHEPAFKAFAERALEVARGPELGLRSDFSTDPLAMFHQLAATHPDNQGHDSD